ncbi:MAG: serine/threonine-protein kinase [Rubricoccaceae bacterium]
MDMDPDSSADWTRLKDLFGQALELAPADRAAFLDDACAGDDQLRVAVQNLLDADSEANDDTGFLDDDAEAEFIPLLGQDASATMSGEGQEVGPYRLLERVGEGGMGDVYRAERADGAFEQTVALKLVKPGMDTRAVLRRFEAERSILARLAHPGIARLLGGGVTETARPWFAMEFVDGIPITEAAPTLPLEVRLDLFDQVCAAVQHAHARLIVHRDLKPSNILVVPGEPTTSGGDTSGRDTSSVALLDFGIAKLLGEEEDASVLTATGVRMMTRAYAAPEQIRGEPVTTATDVYALGVVLYEMLTGHRPFEAAAASELERQILEADPARPSTTLRPDGNVEIVTARQLKGDLDVICLKALRKEPDERYASVEALREDLRRYREGLPVMAQSPTAAYRTRRFIQRHRAGVLMTALSVLIIASGVTFYTIRLAEERDRAERAATRAERTAEFLENLFESSNPGGVDPGSITTREILDVGAEEARENLADEPVVLAQMLATIGRVYRALGLYDESSPLLREAEILFDSTDLDPLGHRDALLELANLRYRTENYDDAQDLAQRALQLDSLHASEEDTERHQILNTIGLIYSDLGTMESDSTKLLRAMSIIDEVIEARRRMDDDDSQTALAVNLSNQGLILMDLGRYDEAEPLLDESIALTRKYRGEQHPYVAFALNSRAGIHQHRGDMDRAIADERQAIEIGEASLGIDHPFLDYARGNLDELIALRDSLRRGN